MENGGSEAIYSEALRVRTFEAGMHGTLKFANLLDHLQNIAADHAESLGVSMAWLEQQHLAWALSRYHVRVDRFPRMGERLILETWPSGFSRLFAIREFRLRDEEGEIIAAGTSGWLLLNRDSLRPVRPSERLPEFPLNPERAIENDFPGLPELDRVEHAVDFRVRMHDLDINQHVNNVVYSEWALESAPAELWERFKPAEIRCMFQGMAYYGDTVRAETEVVERGDAPLCHHRLVRVSDGAELTRLLSRWAPVAPPEDAAKMTA